MMVRVVLERVVRLGLAPEEKSELVELNVEGEGKGERGGGTCTSAVIGSMKQERCNLLHAAELRRVDGEGVVADEDHMTSSVHST